MVWRLIASVWRGGIFHIFLGEGEEEGEEEEKEEGPQVTGPIFE
jgi:hypothetical protein